MKKEIKIITIILLLILMKINKVYAMDVDITPGNPVYYNYNATSTYTGIQSNRTITNLQFYQFHSNNQNARDFKASIYFPQSVNDEIVANQWDISFIVMTSGHPNISLDTKSCEVSNPIPEEYLQIDKIQDNLNDYEIATNYGSLTFYAVNCYNTTFIGVPITLRILNTDILYETNDTYQRTIISRYWNFSQREKTTNNSGVESAITSQTQQVTSKIDEINNADYNGTTEQPNTSGYDSYETNEQALLTNMSNMNLNDVSIAIDNNSSGFVWNTMTRLIQSNSLIFSMIISILSIGIIKLMLSR